VKLSEILFWCVSGVVVSATYGLVLWVAISSWRSRQYADAVSASAGFLVLLVGGIAVALALNGL
jgi:hypothetical protein